MARGAWLLVRDALLSVGATSRLSGQTQTLFPAPKLYFRNPSFISGGHYGRACAVTQEHSLPVLEAAHIRPYAQDGQHAVSNGLTLRTDLHRLFDGGYATVDEQLRFVVSTRLKVDYQNGRSYYGLQGRQLTLPAHRSLWPDPNALAWHRENVFLG